MPKVTVLMPVYNGAQYLREAVVSILRQDFQDFEFLIINDGSTDRTQEILLGFQDPRLRIIHQNNNCGLAASLNRGLEEAQGKYIARMDADDIAIPSRLRKQVAYLEDHPEVDVLGTAYFKINEQNQIAGMERFFEEDPQIKRMMCLKTPEAFLCHPAVMMRKEALKAVGGYNEALKLTQDKDLWIRMASNGCEFANLREPLLKRRKTAREDGTFERYVAEHEKFRNQAYAAHQQALARLWKKCGDVPVPQTFQDNDDLLARSADSKLFFICGVYLLRRGKKKLAKKAFENSANSFVHAPQATLEERRTYSTVCFKLAADLKNLNQRVIAETSYVNALQWLLPEQGDAPIEQCEYYANALLSLAELALAKGELRWARKASAFALRLNGSKKNAYLLWLRTFHQLNARLFSDEKTPLQDYRMRRWLCQQLRHLQTSKILKNNLPHIFFAVTILWKLRKEVRCQYASLGQSVKTKMRIGFVTNEFISEGHFCSGLAQYVYRVAKALSAMGHEVHIFTQSSREPKDMEYQGLALHTVFLEADNLAGRFFARFKLIGLWRVLLFNWKILRRIQRLNAAIPFDLIQFTNAYASSLFAGPLLRIPYTVRISSYRPAWNRHSGKEGTRDTRFREILEAFQIRISPNVYAPSQCLKELLGIHSGIQKVEVIPTPVYVETEHWDTSVYDRYVKGRPYLLFFGGLKPAKGVHLLADCLPAFLKSHPDALALLVGKDIESKKKESSLARNILRQCKSYQDRLIFLDPIPHAQLYPLIQSARIVVLPSLVDNLPNTCLEAMLLGKPVIGTAGASFDEIITDHVDGFLVPPNDPEALAQKIEEVWSSADLDSIGRAAQEKMKRYHPDVVLKDLLAYYGKILKHSGKGNYDLNNAPLQKAECREAVLQ